MQYVGERTKGEKAPVYRGNANTTSASIKSVILSSAFYSNSVEQAKQHIRNLLPELPSSFAGAVAFIHSALASKDSALTIETSGTDERIDEIQKAYPQFGTALKEFKP